MLYVFIHNTHFPSNIVSGDYIKVREISYVTGLDNKIIAPNRVLIE